MNSKGLEKQTVNTVRHRVKRALKILGYPFTVEELNDVMCRVHLAYQGADYLIDINEGDYIRLQLIDGTYAEFDDIEEFSRLRRAINEVNWKSSVTIVYTLLEEEQEVLLSYLAFALAIPQIPCFDKYLEYELNQFYCAQQKVWYELKKLRRAEDQIREELSLPPDEYNYHRMSIMKQKDETQDFFLETLEEMGCHYRVDEENNIILISYKNRHFLSHVHCGLHEILLLCRDWASVDLNDINEVMNMKQAVNIVNSKEHVISYYEKDDDDYELKVSSKTLFYFSSQIKDPKNYLRTKFDDFIDVQQSIDIELEEMRKEVQD